MESKRTRGAVRSAKLRERLEQIKACERSGKSLKAYAERKGLCVDALYQAKKEARRQGLIPPYRRPNTIRAVKSSRPRPNRFVKVIRRADAPVAQGTAWRLRFPGGEVLESSTPLTVEVTLRLIESLARRS